MSECERDLVYEMTAHAEMMWRDMHKHPLYAKLPYMAAEVAYWANQRARGVPLSDLVCRQKWSASGDQSEMELDLTMKSKLWNQDPGVRCLEPNSMHKATDPDFVCPFNRDWDVELKTSSERSDAIRGGGVSHPRKKACYYIHMRTDRRKHTCYSVRMGWVRPEDWCKSGKWIRKECRDRFVELLNPHFMRKDEARRAENAKKNAKRQAKEADKARKASKKLSEAELARQPNIFKAFGYGQE